MHADAANTATGLRVLVIEDQHDIAANIWDFLERRGYLVDHCADGASGLACRCAIRSTRSCSTLACRGWTDSSSAAGLRAPAMACRC